MDENIKIGAFRTEQIPRVRITYREKELILQSLKELNMNFAQYVRYCINKEMEDRSKNGL